jgi:hypothetical protein
VYLLVESTVMAVGQTVSERLHSDIGSTSKPARPSSEDLVGTDMTDEPKTSSENPAGTVSSSDSKRQKPDAKLSQRSGGVARFSLAGSAAESDFISKEFIGHDEDRCDKGGGGVLW